MGYSGRGVYLQGLERRRPRFGEGFLRRSEGVVAKFGVAVSEADIGGGVQRLRVDRLLEVADRLSEVRPAHLAQKVDAPQVSLVCFGIDLELRRVEASAVPWA